VLSMSALKLCNPMVFSIGMGSRQSFASCQHDSTSAHKRRVALMAATDPSRRLMSQLGSDFNCGSEMSGKPCWTGHGEGVGDFVLFAEKNLGSRLTRGRDQ
jgi:hypothetical protein